MCYQKMKTRIYATPAVKGLSQFTKQLLLKVCHDKIYIITLMRYQDRAFSRKAVEKHLAVGLKSYGG